MSKKFLIIRLSSLGDVVHTLPIVNALKMSFPDSRVDWLVGDKGIGLLKLVNEIDNIYKFDLNILSELKEQNYDYVIDVQGLFKTALIGKYISNSNFIGFKNTREFADMFYDMKVDVGPVFKTETHVVDLNMKLLSAVEGMQDSSLKFLIPKVDSDDFKELLNVDKNKVLVLPSTTWDSKMWRLDYWEDLIKKLSKTNKVYIAGAPSDEKLIKPLLDNLSGVENCENLVGKTNLSSLIYLIQNVDLVVGLDSGAIHLANAIYNDYGFPRVFGIYGPTSPFRNGLYNTIGNSIYDKSLDCLICRKKTCPLDSHKCMDLVDVDKVLSTINT